MPQVNKMGSNSTDTKLQTILSKGWLYRGEGNANIVLSIPKTRQIVRIRKVDRPETILKWFLYWFLHLFKCDHKKQLEYEFKCLEFYNKIMLPLLGRAYVCPAVSIFTSYKDIQRLDKDLTPFRPDLRKHKCLQFGLATLLTDYAFLSDNSNSCEESNITYAVEIKPKQGWIPLEDRVSDKCQFCLNQHLKLKNRQIKELTTYCPLDLFSGDKGRMTKALKSLFGNPQNNFRIYRDGISCYGEESPFEIFYDVLRECFRNSYDNKTLMQEFCNLLLEALLSKDKDYKGCENCDDVNSNIMPLNDTYFEGAKCHFFDETKLPPGCVLHRILSLQQLNNLGLHRYHDIYEALIGKDVGNEDWTYVDHLLQKINSNRHSCLKCYIVAPNGDTIFNLGRYLIAAIANDCSFMVTFKKIARIDDRPGGFVIRTRNGYFLVNIGIFDLYPKPTSTIMKHVNRNGKVQEAYNNLI